MALDQKNLKHKMNYIIIRMFYNLGINWIDILFEKNSVSTISANDIFIKTNHKSPQQCAYLHMAIKILETP